MSQCQVPPVPDNIESDIPTILSADIDTVTFLSGGSTRNLIEFIGCVLARIRGIVYRSTQEVQGLYENVVKAFEGLRGIQNPKDL